MLDKQENPAVSAEWFLDVNLVLYWYFSDCIELETTAADQDGRSNTATTRCNRPVERARDRHHLAPRALRFSRTRRIWAV